jgi:hypothetical protein
MAEAQAGQDAGASKATTEQPQDTQQGGQQQEAPKTGDIDPNTGRSYTQAELDRITSKVRRNARREGRIEAERDFYARNAQQGGERKEPEQPKEEQEPQRDQFPDYESYQRAIAKHEGAKAAREEREKGEKEARAKQERESQEKVARTWHGKIEQAMREHDDFEDVLEENDDVVSLVQRSAMRKAITESDIGPKIVRHLCLNRAEAERISKLPEYRQAAEIAKIEDTLAAAAKPKEETDKTQDGKEAKDDAKREEDRERRADGTFKPAKGASKAPPPIEPGTGRGNASDSHLPKDTDDAETWRRKEMARVAAKDAAMRGGR